MKMQDRILERLSKKQKEIYNLMLRGIKQQEIAKKVYISLPTVKKYTKRIKKIVLEEYNRTLKE